MVSPGRGRKHRDLSRRTEHRPAHDRILIVTEGKRSEPNYFNEIRSSLRLSSAHIVVRGGELGTQPQQVVDYSEALFLNGDRHRGIEARAFEAVYAVFDRDDHTTYPNALRSAEALDQKHRNDLGAPVRFQAIPSNPCFELWLLLHFEEIRHLKHRDEVFARLKKHLPGYGKGSEHTYARTKAHVALALQRATGLNAASPFNEDKPFTHVSVLVERLQDLRGP